MRLLIMGPPGAGKGTQAMVVAEHLQIPAISTGEIFRAQVKAGTPLGREVERIVAGGDYVPDSITEQIVAQRLAEPDAIRGWLLDGFPRTLHQVAALEQILGEQRLDGVLSLEVDTDQLVARMLRRAQIEGREDDTEDVIRHRMEVYTAATEPLLQHYRGVGLLIGIDGDGGVDEVAARIRTSLNRLAASVR